MKNRKKEEELRLGPFNRAGLWTGAASDFVLLHSTGVWLGTWQNGQEAEWVRAMSESEDADHPRFFVGADDGEGEELLDPGRVLGYDCLYENVEEEDADEEEYDSVCRINNSALQF